MKQRFFKSVADYDIYLETCTTVFFVCFTTSDNRKYIKILTADGKTPIINGEDSYCDALAAVMRIHSETGKHYCVKTEEIKWKELPSKLQQIFNYKKFRKEHPLKLNKINPEEVYRTPVPEWVKDVEKWLECGSQPFDRIIDEMGLIGITGSQCPICGSRKVRVERYNDLCPEQLAGSAGYIETCEDYGYSHDTVTIMS